MVREYDNLAKLVFGADNPKFLDINKLRKFMEDHKTHVWDLLSEVVKENENIQQSTIAIFDGLPLIKNRNGPADYLVDLSITMKVNARGNISLTNYLDRCKTEIKLPSESEIVAETRRVEITSIWDVPLRKPTRLLFKRVPFNNWTKIRHEILKRDENKCVCCGSQTDLKVHHLKQRMHGGNHDLSNLITLCHACHVRAHSPYNTLQLGEMVERIRSRS